MRLIEQLRWWAAECDRTNFGCQARKLLLEAADALEQSAADVVERDDLARVQVAHDKVGQALNVAGAFYAQGYHDAMTDHNLVERKHGEWEAIIGQPHLMECSNCGSFSIEGNYNFCPNCGCDMRGEKHEAD